MQAQKADMKNSPKNVCECGSVHVCLSLIKCKNVSQYLTNTISRNADTIIASWYLSFSLIPIWLCALSFFLSYTLHCVLITGCMCMCVSVLRNRAGWTFLGGRRITDGPCQISVHLASFLYKSSKHTTHTYMYMLCMLSKS